MNEKADRRDIKIKFRRIKKMALKKLEDSRWVSLVLTIRITNLALSNLLSNNDYPQPNVLKGHHLILMVHFKIIPQKSPRPFATIFSKLNLHFD